MMEVDLCPYSKLVMRGDPIQPYHSRERGMRYSVQDVRGYNTTVYNATGM